MHCDYAWFKNVSSSSSSIILFNKIGAIDWGWFTVEQNISRFRNRNLPWEFSYHKECEIFIFTRNCALVEWQVSHCSVDIFKYDNMFQVKTSNWFLFTLSLQSSTYLVLVTKNMVIIGYSVINFIIITECVNLPTYIN